MLKKINRNLLIYCIASLAIIGVILLNSHNDRFSNYDDYNTIQVEEVYRIPYDNGLYTDESTGFEGVFARSGWFYMPNTGDFELKVFADTRSETNLMELWVSDGRSEECIVSMPLYEGNGISVASFDSMPSAKYAEIRVVFGGTGYLTVKSMEVYSDRGFGDTWITAIAATLFFLAMGLYLFRVKKDTSLLEDDQEKSVNYVVLLAAAFIVSIPVFIDYLYVSHDILFHLSRIEAIKDALLGGQFPVRNYVSGAFGYGYGAPLFYPDIFLYIPAFLRVLGASQPFAYNAFIILLNAATVFITYYAANRIFKNRFTAMMTSVLYVTALYRLINIYMRGALGETIAMTFFPLIIAGLYEIFFGDKKKWWIAALGYTGVIQSHILSVMMVMIFSILFGVLFIVKIFRDKRWLSLIKAIAMVVAVNLWFLVPFAQMYSTFPTDFNYQRVTSYLMSPYLSQIFGIFVNASGFAKAVGDARGEMGQGIGLALILSVILLLIWFAARKRGSKFVKDERFALGAFIFGLAAIWMCSYHFPLRSVVESGALGEMLNRIQYPWRLLAIVTVCFSFAGAVGVSKFGKRYGAKQVVALIVALAAIIPNGYFLYRVQEEFEIITRTQPVTEVLLNYREYLPVGFLPLEGELLARSRDPVYQNTEMQTVEATNSNKEYVLTYTGGAGEIDLPMIYYPGYSARDEAGNKLDVTHNPGMYLRVVAEKSEGTITVRYTGFTLWRICDIVSLVAILLMVGFAVAKKTNVNRKRKRATVVTT